MKKIFFTLSLLCIALSAMASNKTKKDSTDIFDKHLTLNEVIVTGLTGNTKLKSTPSPVAVMTPHLLQSRAYTNIIDALATMPGIAQITTGSGISKPVIRGLGYNRLIVINDGIRQEGQQWGDEHGIEIDGSTVHSAEVIKGPASLMYGSDAMAGVVIFHNAPLPMEGTVKANVSTEYQTNNGLYHYSLNNSGNLNGWVWDLRYSDKAAHAYKNSYDGVVPNSQFKERAASGLFGINRNWGYSRLTLSYYNLTPSMVEGERNEETGKLEGDATGYKKGLPFQQIYHYKAVLDNTINLNNGNLKAIVGWQQNRRQEFEESPTEYGLYFHMNTINYDFRYTTDMMNGWKFAAGTNGMYQKSQNKGTEYLIPAYNLFDIGVFATASKEIGKWELTGGLRGDLRKLHSKSLEDDGEMRFEAFNRDFSGITGSIGGVFHVTDKINIRANVARGFRAPNLSELGSNGVHEGTFRYEQGNKDLKPEFSLQGDLGFDISSKYFSAQVSAFANRIDNYIFPAKNGLTKTSEGTEYPVFVYQAGDARLLGFEAALDIHPIHSLHFENTFSYVDAQQMHQKGDMKYLPMTPAPRWTSELKYEFSHNAHLFNNSFISFGLDYNACQNHFYGADGTETKTNGYTLLNASLGTDIIIRNRKRASIYFIAENLADIDYQSHLSRLKYTDINKVTGRQGVFNMGRNFIIKLNIPII